MSNENKLTHEMSFLVKERVSETVYPKWWEFWRKPVTTETEQWVRKTLQLTDREANFLLADEGMDSPRWSLLMRAMTGKVEYKFTGLILCENFIEPNYITTEGLAGVPAFSIEGAAENKCTLHNIPEANL